MKIAFVVYLLFFVALAWLGAVCVNYTLLHTLHHTIGFVWAFLLSLVTGDLTIPAAIVVWVLVHLGILS